MTLRDRLDAAALRLSASDPAYLGYWLDRHRSHEQIDDAELARKLGVAPERLAMLALCRTPEGNEFAAQVTAIATLTGANGDAITSLVRQEQTLSAWAAPRPTANATSPGWMMAAHDADQPPPGAVDKDETDARRVD